MSASAESTVSASSQAPSVTGGRERSRKKYRAPEVPNTKPGSSHTLLYRNSVPLSEQHPDSTVRRASTLSSSSASTDAKTRNKDVTLGRSKTFQRKKYKAPPPPPSLPENNADSVNKTVTLSSSQTCEKLCDSNPCLNQTAPSNTIIEDARAIIEDLSPPSSCSTPIPQKVLPPPVLPRLRRSTSVSTLNAKLSHNDTSHSSQVSQSSQAQNCPKSIGPPQNSEHTDKKHQNHNNGCSEYKELHITGNPERDSVESLAVAKVHDSSSNAPSQVTTVCFKNENMTSADNNNRVQDEDDESGYQASQVNDSKVEPVKSASGNVGKVVDNCVKSETSYVNTHADSANNTHTGSGDSIDGTFTHRSDEVGRENGENTVNSNIAGNVENEITNVDDSYISHKKQLSQEHSDKSAAVSGTTKHYPIANDPVKNFEKSSSEDVSQESKSSENKGYGDQCSRGDFDRSRTKENTVDKLPESVPNSQRGHIHTPEKNLKANDSAKSVPSQPKPLGFFKLQSYSERQAECRNSETKQPVRTIFSISESQLLPRTDNKNSIQLKDEVIYRNVDSKGNRSAVSRSQSTCFKFRSYHDQSKSPISSLSASDFRDSWPSQPVSRQSWTLQRNAVRASPVVVNRLDQMFTSQKELYHQNSSGFRTPHSEVKAKVAKPALLPKSATLVRQCDQSRSLLDKSQSVLKKDAESEVNAENIAKSPVQSAPILRPKSTIFARLTKIYAGSESSSTDTSVNDSSTPESTSSMDRTVESLSETASSMPDESKTRETVAINNPERNTHSVPSAESSLIRHCTSNHGSEGSGSQHSSGTYSGTDSPASRKPIFDHRSSLADMIAHKVYGKSSHKYSAAQDPSTNAAELNGTSERSKAGAKAARSVQSGTDRKVEAFTPTAVCRDGESSQRNLEDMPVKDRMLWLQSNEQIITGRFQQFLKSN